MKRILIFIKVLALFTVQGQNTNPSRKILIGFNFSPDYNFRTLKNNDGNFSGDLVIESRNGVEMAKFGYTAGLNSTFTFTRQTGLETGIQYANKGYKTKNQNLVYFPPNTGLPANVRMNYSYSYIGIPVKVRFTFGKNKLQFVTGAGFITNFLWNIKQTSTYQYSDGKTEKKKQSTTSDFKKVDISSVLSVGIDYKLTNKIYIVIEPTGRYGLLNTKDAPVTERLWNVGINFGFHYRLM